MFWLPRMSCNIVVLQATSCSQCAVPVSSVSFLGSCTTSKPTNRLDIRIILASGGHPFTSISKYIGLRLRENLCTVRHIYANTPSILRDLSGVCLDEDDRLIKIDIKDFFDCGTPSTLTKHAFCHVADTSERKCLVDMLDWLLQHQFLRDEVNDVVYQMTEGSGQGMAASGEVASTTFLYDVEKHSALVPILEESFQLKFYGRYVDNIFFDLS